MNNGRGVDERDITFSTSYANRDGVAASYQLGLRGLGKEQDAVNALFFHRDNIAALQTSIRYAVYRRSGQVIDPQSHNELLSVMTGVYQRTGTDAYADPVPQVRKMNASVIDAAAKEIVNAVSYHLWYLNDISRPVPEPQSRGSFESIKGERSLELPHFGA
jgi:hypothetical protein